MARPIRDNVACFSMFLLLWLHVVCGISLHGGTSQDVVSGMVSSHTQEFGRLGDLRRKMHRKLRAESRRLLQQSDDLNIISAPISEQNPPQCFMAVNYKATVVDGTTIVDGNPTRYYLSSFALGNVSTMTNITSWKLGVSLPGGDYVRDAAEVLEPTKVQLLQNGTSPVFGSTKGSYITQDNPLAFQFVQLIGSNVTSPSPVENVVFNNLRCELGKTEGDTFEINPRQPRGEIVQLRYLPVQYRNTALNGTSFVFKLKNMQEISTINLADLKVRYYFHGIDQPPEAVFQNPGDFFNASCDTNSGALDCSGVNVEILPGVRNISGAQFVVEMTFDEDSRPTILQPIGQEDTFLVQEESDTTTVDEVEILVKLRPNEFTSFKLNDTMDYSYQDTSEVPNSSSEDYIQRVFDNNPNMTVYFNDTRIWGIPPGPKTEDPALNSTSYSCSKGGQCEFIAEYCCRPFNPCEKTISSTAPEIWPPIDEEITNLTCPDGSILNNTDNTSGTSGSSMAWVIGLVVGLSCAVILMGFAFYFWRSRKISSLQEKSAGADSSPDGNAFAMPDSSELSWVIPIHKRLGGSDVLTSEPSAGTPISSRQSSALLTNHALTVSGSKLMRTIDSRGNVSGATDMGSPKTPQSSMSPIVPGYMGVTSLPPNVERLVDFKCETISGRINVHMFRHLEENGRGPTQDDCSSSRDSGMGDQVDEAFTIEDWQLTRSKSWDGCLLGATESDSQNAARKIKRRRESNSSLGMLPPLSPTPLPMMGDDIVANIDLHVPSSVIERHLGKCLGTGGFGAVYKGKYKGMDVAVKKLPPFVKLSSGHDDGGQSAYEALIREIKLASKFDCDRLVKVYGACTDDKNKCCLIMELMSGGNLYQRIHDKNRRRITYIEILQIVNDIAEGLAYLHPFVIHRDLKPQNILLDAEGRAKIADFGISKVKDPSKSYLTQMTAENGTPMYMSPEQMNGGKVDEKVDVYALGCIMNEMWTRRQPWKDTNHFFQIILKVAVNGDRPWVDPEAPEPLKRLIKKCWHQDPHQRPSCAEILRRTDILIREELDKWDAFRNREISFKSTSSNSLGESKHSAGTS